MYLEEAVRATRVTAELGCTLKRKRLFVRSLAGISVPRQQSKDELTPIVRWLIIHLHSRWGELGRNSRVAFNVKHAHGILEAFLFRRQIFWIHHCQACRCPP